MVDERTASPRLLRSDGTSPSHRTDRAISTPAPEQGAGEQMSPETEEIIWWNRRCGHFFWCGVVCGAPLGALLVGLVAILSDKG